MWPHATYIIPGLFYIQKVSHAKFTDFNEPNMTKSCHHYLELTKWIYITKTEEFIYLSSYLTSLVNQNLGMQLDKLFYFFFVKNT